ncbi:MAG: signal peptidase II [Oscillospiraceae bacterium]
MIIALFAAILLLVSADQLIKIWAVSDLKGAGSVPFIKIGSTEILNLNYLENDGAVFGSFSGMKFMLIGVTAVMIIVCTVFMIKNYKNSKFLAWSLMLVISGGIGNIIDRIFRDGRVIDYFEIRLFNFAIFNFADCCVVIGVILLFVYILFIDGKNQKVTAENK